VVDQLAQQYQQAMSRIQGLPWQFSGDNNA